MGTGWNTVLTATANAGANHDGHVVIHTVGQDGNVHFYDHFGATDGDPTWADVSGVVVRTGWTG